MGEWLPRRKPKEQEAAIDALVQMNWKLGPRQAQWDSRCLFCPKEWTKWANVRYHMLRNHGQDWARYQKLKDDSIVEWKEAVTAVENEKKRQAAEIRAKHKRSYYSIDLETTHNYLAEIPEIISLALWQVDLYAEDGDELKEVFYQKFEPFSLISAEATSVHGLTNELLKGYPRFTPSVAHKIVELVHGGMGLIGWNLGWDMRVLQRAMVKLGMPNLLLHKRTFSPNARCCVKSALAEKGTITTDCKLVTAFRHIVGHELIGAHDASIDAMAVAQIYVAYAKPYRV